MHSNPLHRERNAVYKRRFAYRIALLYPSTYQASLSSLGFQIIYYTLNSIPEVYAERVVDEEEVPRSIETGTPLTKFDLILASAYYELEYPIIARMLRSAGLSPLRKEREGPPLIVGGPSPTALPDPLYDIADAVYRGEAEEVLARLVDVLAGSRGKREFLENLAEVDGMWVPEIREDAGIVKTRDLNSAFHPIAQIQSLDEEPVWGRALLVEPSRGCNRGCYFCMEAAITRPRRERDYRILEKIIVEGTRVNGLRKVAFYSLSFFDSPLGEKLLDLLIEMRLEGSIPSVRADVLDDSKIEKIREVGQRTLVIAPETPSPELQKRIGKVLPNHKIIEIARTTARLGMNLKLYYMIGLPGEKEEDLEMLVEQVRMIHESFKSRDRVRVSLNPFIPKPCTRMWIERMEDEKTLKKKIMKLRKELSGVARVDFYPPRHARRQYEINRLGRNATSLILELSSKY